MPGSEAVNANLAAWLAGKHKELEAAMDSHIQGSVRYVQQNYRWTIQTGHALQAINKHTESSVANIVSTIYGAAPHNLYLERAWFFHGRYAIIEAARNNNLALLWAKVAAIMGR